MAFEKRVRRMTRYNRTLIEVMKGMPTRAKYAVFYDDGEDPVYFEKTYADMTKRVRMLKKKKSVDNKSIRVFMRLKVVSLL